MATEGFPDHPVFQQLLKSIPLNDGVIIQDPNNGVTATFDRFMNDVVELRRTIREQIPDLLDSNGITRDEGVYICTLAPASYEIFVATFAIWSVGAALSPLATGLTPQEVSFLIQRNKAVLLIASASQRDAAAAIQTCIKNDTGHAINVIGVDLTVPVPSTKRQYHIDKNIVFSPRRPLILLHTSGTTGPPKGVIRTMPAYDLRTVAGASNDDVALCHRAVHWGFGIYPPVASISNGLPIYIVDPDPSPEQIWEVIRQQKITMAYATNLTLLRLMQYYKEHLAVLEPEKVKEYSEGMKKIKYIGCGGTVPMPSVGQFWKDMRGGNPITILYGTTEGGGGTSTTPEGYDVTKRVIGKPMPGVEVKLSEGDHGEILLKSADLFLGYLNNEAATKATFDENGFYKTGDLARIEEDGNYVIDGRVNEDFVRSRTLKVGTLELEDKLSELPYLAEAYVVAVPDMEILHRVAVIARLNPSFKEEEANSLGPDGKPTSNMLFKVRRDLTELKVAQYKLPTLLRVLKDDDVIPRTTTDKVIRKKVIQIFFPQSADCKVEDLPKEVLVWDLKNDKNAESTGLWDWAAAQD
ncbi:malonate--CoA ligase [Trichophyton mentagrophytes]|nr:malonate--CoA ligase [Trichophyton mentagrophytes]